MNRTILTFFLFLLLSVCLFGQTARFIVPQKTNETFVLTQNTLTIPIYIDQNDFPGVIRAINTLRNDFKQVTGNEPVLYDTILSPDKRVLLIGTVGKNQWIDQLIKEKKINKNALENKKEKFLIQCVSKPFSGIDEALVIAGSDKRGTIYGIYELSNQIGVSPWYYWADVPIRKQENLYFQKGSYTAGEPAIRFRGIFLNDEAPALSSWASETFGGFNHSFYEKVFELILRLKGNFLWPAMWGSAFYDDDPLNGSLADEMGIVIGTSHHEPLGRAHDEWRRYGSGTWDYTKNATTLKKFWTDGMERMKDHETVVTIGMRGDGDEPMSEEANISLLERIVKDQRRIIANVTQKKITETPQVWALYKEVQDYYDKGMRVPDDVTLLLCDDNWGNVRKLPDPNTKPRKGGYGMYYHFDYVGGPRNYKWLNVSQVPRIWEQMNLTYRYGVKELWVVNVGDLKPMEYPIQFFLDMAWDPDRFNETNLLKHTEAFCARQFGEVYAKEAARLINLYTKYNRRVTPELLNSKTYSLHHYNEFERVRNEYSDLLFDAMKLNYFLPDDVKEAYDQLVLYPVQACSNLYDLYYAVAMNRDLAKKNDPNANQWADRAKAYFKRDSLLTEHYHTAIANGKWNHMMSQTHIGYTYWQQPPFNVMPEVFYVPEPPKTSSPLFLEKDNYISIEAAHFSRKSQPGETRWMVIPDLGKTVSAVTTTPVIKIPDENTYLEYDIEFSSAGEVSIEIYVSPTLNFNGNKGLSYAVSLAGGKEQTVNFNGHYRGELGQWQAESIIRTATKHHILSSGKWTLRFRPLDPGIVLQKIVIDTGGVKPSYLGPPESGLKN
ncbi:MAG: glycosyl hydrolase 115 family protein [Massilibacteroides sp.]|nr:glycosyl hydrolase 115 family protein [Massilibacteroides sp.]MDD4659128.1 glycosyl hydrolase 115 family protein [Massilibacteroides sp.]